MSETNKQPFRSYVPAETTMKEFTFRAVLLDW